MARRILRGKRVLITGASSGIGAALAQALALEGCRLSITGRREGRLGEIAARLRASAESIDVLAGDLIEPATRQALAAFVADRFHGLDGLINNAGLGGWGAFATSDEARLRQVMEVNFFAPAELIRILLPFLREGRQPIIVNIGSVLGHRAVPNKSEYCASKFALHGLSDALRAELVAEGIDVLHVCPSTTRTEFFERVLADEAVERPAPQRATRGAMAPEAVAARVVSGMRRGQHEIVLSWGGKLLVWLDRCWPWLADQLVAKFGQN